MNFLRTARRLERVTRGVGLLRRKREALVAELFGIARPAADARAQIAAAARRAYPALLGALTAQGRLGLRPLGWPTRELAVEMEPGSIWGIPVSQITARPPLVRTLAARATAPGLIGPDAAAATGAFEHLAELLLDAAPREMLIRRLGEALAQTSRQVNTLERRLAPALASAVIGIRRALDEREREERLRQKHNLTITIKRGRLHEVP
jgi:V/A-type H+-transporting ATPase subunit D